MEEYYKARKRLEERLRNDHSEEDVNMVVKQINERDFQRISRGLDSVTRLLQKLEPLKRHKSALTIPLQLALFEALCSDVFLLDAPSFQMRFQTPFNLVQTNKRLNIARFVPAATAFLFDSDQNRRDWAIHTWAKYKRNPTTEEFDYAIKGPLVRHLQSLSYSVPDEATLQRTWHGVSLLVNNLDNDLVTHSLRAMEIDIFKLALDHLKFEKPSLWALVETIQKLLEIAPKDFWDSMGAISATTFVEQIFNNAQYDRFLEASKPSDLETASPLLDLLSWIKPFMSSLDTAHQAGVCVTLSNQLLERLQADRFPEVARVECYRTGLALLAWTLNNLNKDASFSSTGRIIVKDVLEIVGKHMCDIAKIPSRADDMLKASCMELSLRIVKLALALECKSIRTDQESVKQMKDSQDLPAGSGTYVTPIWEGVVRNLNPGNIDLAKAALVGINDMTGYEKFKVNPDDTHGKEKSAYNIKLGRLTHLVYQILERINDFGAQELDQLYQSPDSATALVSSLLSADSNLFEAGVNVVKTLSAEFARREAIGHILKTFTATSLNAFSWAIRRIVRNRSYAPCPRMLKTVSDVIDVLCDSQGGLLRTMSIVRNQQAEAIETFWQEAWEGLRTIYEMTETWGRTKVEDHAILKEFCRDTMQFSERLFDQYSVFANALQSSSLVTSEDGDDCGTDINMKLLRYPTTTMQPLVKWLRLRDLFLVEIAVNLTKKVLGQLTEYNRNVDDSTSNQLEQIIIGGPQGKTHLSPREKAELARALEANLGRPIVQTIEVDSESTPAGTRSSSPHVSLQVKKTKAAPIDLDAWHAKAKGGDSIAAQVAEFSHENEYATHDLPDRDMLSAGRSLEITRRTKGQEGSKGQIGKSVFQHKKAGDIAKHPRTSNFPSKPLPSATEQASFREKRKQEQEAQKKRNAEQLAMRKRKAGIGVQIPGQGSALHGLGIQGKDHAPQGPSMMVSSDSESESDSDDDEEVLGLHKPLSFVAPAVREYQASKAQIRKGPVKKMKQVRSAKDMRARLQPDLTALHKELLGWDFFHQGDFPPSSNRQDYHLVTNIFRTPVDYQSTFEPLLMLEAWQSLSQAKEDGNFKVFETKVASRMSVDTFIEVSTSMGPTEAKEAAIGEADIVLLSKGKSPATEASQPHSLARVWKISRKKNVVEVTYRLNAGNELINLISPNVTLHCAKILSIIPVEREYGSLKGLQYFDLCDEIIRAKPSPLLEYSEQQLNPLISNYKINLAQAKAVRSAVDNDAFTLIQGPPGSGKTKTIVAIVGALLTNSIASQGQPVGRPISNILTSNNEATAKKLLICAPSNAAVDELVMRFKRGVTTLHGESRPLSVVRLGRSDAINTNVLDVTLEELVNSRLNLVNAKDARPGEDIGKLMSSHKTTCEEFNNLRATVDALKASGQSVSAEQNHEIEVLKREKEQLSKQIDSARDSGDRYARNAELNRRKLQQEILDGAHILCATLSGSGHDMFHNLNIEFETVIIDEAAQSIELSALIPLKYGCSKCILVGDPKQLPPTVLSREAARFQYEQSLFVRMQENHPSDVHLLDTQYRMHPDISAFPSNAFYGGKLVDGPHMARQRSRPWHESSTLGTYRFFDVQGFHQSAHRGHSLINLAEIDVALKLYHRLITDCQGYDFKGKIGIITPYKSQLRELRSRFAHKHSDDVLTTIEFNTTDAFQGRESEIIIFSCVRASSTRGIGFLSDIRRMNVGITRAKSSLWVLGNANSLMRGEFWGKMIEDAKRRNVYLSGDLNKLLQKSQITTNMQSSTPTRTPLPGNLTKIQTVDIDMPDAPLSCNGIKTTPNRRPSGSSTPILNGHRTSQASGAGNGLNSSFNCGTCGSFRHQTSQCDHEEALQSTQARCKRCREFGHTLPYCMAERCFICGEIGHLQERCTSGKPLPSKDRQIVGRQENEYRKAKAQMPELHRKRQLGDHDGQVPIVYPSAESLVPDQTKKRKIDDSPKVSAPKGPKLHKDDPKPTESPGVVNGLHKVKSTPGKHGTPSIPPTPRTHPPSPPPPTPPGGSPHTVIKAGEGLVRVSPGDQLPARPPPPMRATVKPPKRRKEADPLIRPKKR